MKAITICQPWAWLIVHGYKTIENRTWQTGHRGPLAIHAGKGKKWLHVCDDWRLHVPELPDAKELPMGCIVGTVELIGCVPLADLPVGTDMHYASGPICWRMANARHLAEPVPHKGQLSLYDIVDLHWLQRLHRLSSPPTG